MEQALLYVVFVVGLAGVMKGGDWLVNSAVWFADKLRISPVIIGATVVSIGTTLPEMVISGVAAYQGRGAVVIGTALGSILCNAGLILGLHHIFKTSSIRSRDTLRKMGIMMASVALLALLGADGEITRPNGALLLGLFLFYLLANIRRSRRAEGRAKPMDGRDTWRQAAAFVFGLAFVVLGARLLVESGVEIARSWGISELVIAATLFAVGSSLPELITSVAAAVKGHGGLFLGNVIGANIFNVLLVIGVSSLIRPVSMDPTVLVQDIPAALVIMAVLVIPSLITRSIGRRQGAAAFILYAAYISWLLYRG